MFFKFMNSITVLKNALVPWAHICFLYLEGIHLKIYSAAVRSVVLNIHGWICSMSKPTSFIIGTSKSSWHLVFILTEVAFLVYCFITLIVSDRLVHKTQCINHKIMCSCLFWCFRFLIKHAINFLCIFCA